MEINFGDIQISINRPETELDSFVKDFIGVLDRSKVRYVIVSGYVSILFGRSRNSEDVDIFIERLDTEHFDRLWTTITSKFDSIITDDRKDAFDNYLGNGLSVRFARKNAIIPNMEVRFPKSSLDRWALSNALTASLNGFPLKISPLELQIAYKLYLGSDKDFEDARHLWLVSKEHLNGKTLKEFVKLLKQEKNAAKWLT